MERNSLYKIKDIQIIKDEEIFFTKISTDTRSLRNGDFYLPLKGENFDGEEFISKAVEQGCVGFLTTKEDIAKIFIKNNQLKFIGIVKDTKLAYMELAALQIKSIGCKIIGITGSSGKTTVKEMIASVVSQGFKTHKTNKNYNNEIGFCQTVFEAPKETEIIIIEMGMRGLGEIDLIAKYALPDIAVITNVGTAHIGRLGSRENIATAKCEIANYLSNNSIFIAKNDDLILSTIKFKGEKKYFSSNDVEILNQSIGISEFNYKGSRYSIPIEGIHNIENALAAILVGQSLGLSNNSINKGLMSFVPIENRWNTEKAGKYNIINDCYNANPESMKATIDTVLNMYDSPTIILGDMGELGENSHIFHKQIGEFINSHSQKTQNLSVITVGKFAKFINDELKNCFSINFPTIDNVAEYILKNDFGGNILFFKASRSMRFEHIINKIKGDVIK